MSKIGAADTSQNALDIGCSVLSTEETVGLAHAVVDEELHGDAAFSRDHLELLMKPWVYVDHRAFGLFRFSLTHGNKYILL